MKKNTKMLALSAMFVALIAVFAQISFPIPGTPIVFTMGIMGVMLTGLMLPWGYAFLALIVYLLLGAVGLPVFSSFGAGLGTLLGPTGGFLMVYPIMVITAAGMWRLFQPIASRKWKNRIVRVLLSEPVLSFLAAEVCMIPCYLGGALWYMFSAQADWTVSLAATVFPFIWIDLIKAVLSGLLATALRRALRAARLLPSVSAHS